ncbi:CCA tRNA nucleotidyltransferase [Bacillus sp. 31A1R]|uniref:CCA-adding enzyme n=1 Tax=Robertmurraya mangrovi TaxID=3098077 RepID=A0ABU5J1G0_9BACI|nr:CCA tRNA nucleotidyltransferase [Bacillus sp. 31A1R]MDZ5473234.1 CCA tRNA nucleotidyltransferase [Bacillus sp. 31A1R]
MNEAFVKAAPILIEIEKAGYEAYFVGGSVRDFLLKKEIDDVDIATSATPEEIKSIFSKTIDVGIEHGTVVVLFQGASYEITTFRAEAEYRDFRRPSEVAFIRSLKEDLQRRDFTMNAIAMDKEGQLFDPFNGQQAITEEEIVTVGEASERFQEDALRMMRAVRFMSQLSFNIENGTSQALIEYGHLLEHIAVERKTVEFEKLLSGKNRLKAIELLIQTKLYQYLPGLSGYEKGLLELVSFDIRELDLNETWSIMIKVLGIHNVERFLKKWRLPTKQIRTINKLTAKLEVRNQREWSREDLYETEWPEVASVEKIFNVLNHRPTFSNIHEVEKKYREIPIKNRGELKVTGTDLMEWYNLKGGPWINDSLGKIEQAILSGKVSNEKERIREWLMRCNHN